MGVDFNKVFGGNSTAAAAATANAKPKAQFWLNIGYATDQKDEQGEFKFVSLAAGIPMDTMETLATNGKNQTFAMFQAARNSLRDFLVNEAKQLKPGEAAVTESIPSFYGLQIQLRRVSEETQAPVDGTNPFMRSFAATAGK